MEDKEVVYIHYDFHFLKEDELKGEKRQFDMLSNCP